jgi:hypothetical protein
VAKLRAFGNAIDRRPSEQFIGAYLDVCADATKAREAAE